MMIHAYSEDYLNNAQKILGDMMDYAVNTYEFSPNQFYEMFLVSDVSMPVSYTHLETITNCKKRIQLI